MSTPLLSPLNFHVFSLKNFAIVSLLCIFQKRINLWIHWMPPPLSSSKVRSHKWLSSPPPNLMECPQTLIFDSQQKLRQFKKLLSDIVTANSQNREDHRHTVPLLSASTIGSGIVFCTLFLCGTESATVITSISTTKLELEECSKVYGIRRGLSAYWPHTTNHAWNQHPHCVWVLSITIAKPEKYNSNNSIASAFRSLRGLK